MGQLFALWTPAPLGPRIGAVTLASIAARNLWRNKLRAALTIFGVTLAIVTFVLLRTIVRAHDVFVEYSGEDRLVSRPRVSAHVRLPKKYVDQVRAVPGVRAATGFTFLGGVGPKGSFIPAFACDDTVLDVFGEVVVPPDQWRRWLENRQGAIVGDLLAARQGLQPGDRVTLTDATVPGDWQFTVEGISTAVDDPMSMHGSMFIFHWEYLNEKLPADRRDQIDAIFSRVSDAGRGPAVAEAVDRAFEGAELSTVTMSERAMNLANLAEFSAILRAVDVASVIIFAIMMLVLGNSIAMSVRERTSEYGMMRAVGFRPAHVLRLVIGEAAAIGAAAGLLGVALSYPVVELGMGRWLEENMGDLVPYFRIGVATPAIAFTCALGLAVAAGLLPALAASRVPVADALRKVG